MKTRNALIAQVEGQAFCSFSATTTLTTVIGDGMIPVGISQMIWAIRQGGIF